MGGGDCSFCRFLRVEERVTGPKYPSFALPVSEGVGEGDITRGVLGTWYCRVATIAWCQEVGKQGSGGERMRPVRAERARQPGEATPLRKERRSSGGWVGQRGSVYRLWGSRARAVFRVWSTLTLASDDAREIPVAVNSSGRPWPGGEEDATMRAAGGGRVK